MLRTFKHPRGHRFRDLSVGQRGLSLIELMVALTLGLILLGVVVQVFLSQRQTFSATEALARVQENNRFVAELTREPARALALQGFCGGNAVYRNHVNLDAAENPSVVNGRRAVGGWEYLGTGGGADFTIPPNFTGSSASSAWDGDDMGELPDEVLDRIVPFSDVLLVRELRPVPGRWPVATELAEADFVTNMAHGINQCATVLVTNCVRADFFQNTASATNELERGGSGCEPANNSGQWQFFYEDDAHLYHVIPHLFFVGLSDTTGEPGFYRLSFEEADDPQLQELVEGVETLQILYGYSAPAPIGDGQRVNRWYSAAEVPNWELVIAVRMDAVVRSKQAVGGPALSVQFEIGEGSTVTLPPDRLLRHPVTATLALRNRMITQ